MPRQKGFCKILKDILKSRVSETEAKMLSDAGFEIKNPTKSAVIMAALMAYYETNYPKCEFTVKRIKRVRRNDYA